MTFKGVYRDGVVILDDSTGLRDGQVMVVQPATRGTSARSVTLRTKSRAKAGRNKTTARARNPRQEATLPGFGMWRDRPDWKGMTTVEIAAELRKRAMGRFGG